MVKYFIEKGSVLGLFIIGAVWVSTSIFGINFSEGNFESSKNIGYSTQQTTSCIDYIGTGTLPERCKSVEFFGFKIGE